MSLKKYYQKKSLPQLSQELKIENIHRLPRLQKVIVMVGLSQARFDKKETEDRIKTLIKITGQTPKPLKAKKAISNFKIRQGQIIAYMVTLRGQRMYDFVERLIHVVLPRIRDFRGIPTYSFDANGNLSIGLKEQIAFPEIKMEEIEKMHGLEITIVTSARNKTEAIALLKALGAVVNKNEKQKKEKEATYEELQQTRQTKKEKEEV